MKKYFAIFQAILAALLFGISAPISKLLLEEISPYLLAALLYLGAGIGMLGINMIKKISKRNKVEANLTKKELPFIILMILLDIAAPIFLLVGLTKTAPQTASLLNNFEIVATSLIALIIFKETIGKRLWLSISLITISSIILSLENVLDFSKITFSIGAVFVLLACISWGLENNCTRKLSIKDPLQVVVLKGFGSGLGSFLIACIVSDISGSFLYIIFSLVLGFFAYGLSIYFYVSAQRHLGASRTSAYYAVAPFIGVGLSFIIFKDPITYTFVIGLIIMIIGTYFAVNEKHIHEHKHEYLEHEHRHSHQDGHHNHTHDFLVEGEHSHKHIHEEMEHTHEHTPDLHHHHAH